MDKLKPCPFCGRSARVSSMPYMNRVLYFVRCNGMLEGKYCLASQGMIPPTDFRGWYSREHAIEAWNRRTDADK